jgi:hypothetical protein
MENCHPQTFDECRLSPWALSNRCPHLSSASNLHDVVASLDSYSIAIRIEQERRAVFILLVILYFLLLWLILPLHLLLRG